MKRERNRTVRSPPVVVALRQTSKDGFSPWRRKEAEFCSSQRGLWEKLATTQDHEKRVKERSWLGRDKTERGK